MMEIHIMNFLNYAVYVRSNQKNVDCTIYTESKVISRGILNTFGDILKIENLIMIYQI